MNTQEQIDKLAQIAASHERQLESIAASMKTQSENIAKLADVVNTLASTVLSHDAQIDEQRELLRNLMREWQAYLRRLPPQ